MSRKSQVTIQKELDQQKLTVYLDSREPAYLKDWLPKRFPDIQFEVVALSEGDFATDKCIFERKTIADLYGSIVGADGKEGRIRSQISRLTTHQQDKFVFFLVVGSMKDFETLMKKMKIQVDLDVIRDMIDSMIVRDNLRIVIEEDEKAAFTRMVKIMRRIHEGQLDTPKIRNMDQLAARLLGITNNQWLELKRIHGSSLQYISTLKDTDLQKVKGLGKMRSKRIKDIITYGWE